MAGSPTPDPGRRWATGPLSATGVVAAAVAPRSRLWRVALREVLRLARPGWWRRVPLLPLPSPGLWKFRMTTAYGSPTARPTPEDVVSFLEWVDALDRAARHQQRREGAPTAAGAR